MKFSANFASSSDAVPNSIEDQNKKGLHLNLILYSAGIRDLFMLTAIFCLVILTLTLNKDKAEISSGGR